MDLEEDDAPVGGTRPPRRFRIRIRKTHDIVIDDLFRFLNARGEMTNDCQMGNLFFSFFFFFNNKNKSHNGL